MGVRVGLVGEVLGGGVRCGGELVVGIMGLGDVGSTGEA